MVKETKPELDILQSCSTYTSHWIEDVEFESVIAVWASVFAHKTTHAQFVVQCIYATAVFGNKGPAFTLLLLATTCLHKFHGGYHGSWHRRCLRRFHGITSDGHFIT